MLRVQIDLARCVGCRDCLNSCPADVFGFDTDANKAVALYAADCFACLLCVEDCPSDAITVDTGLASLGYRSIYDQIDTIAPADPAMPPAQPSQANR